MKNILIIFGILICGLVSSQTMTVPTSYITSTSAVQDTFINWEIRGWIIPTESTNGADNTTTFSITSGFDPENSDLNSINTAGGNTSNWPLYLRSVDSTVFAETLPSSVGDNLYDIKGRYTSALLTWGNFLEVDHEVYWNAFNNNYHILAAKSDGTLMTLSEVITIRNASTAITGYTTVPSLKSITPSNLYQRTDYNVWTQNPFGL